MKIFPFLPDNLLLHYFTSSTSQRIETYNHPLPRTKQSDDWHKQQVTRIANVIFSFYILVGLAVFAGATTKFIIRCVKLHNKVRIVVIPKEGWARLPKEELVRVATPILLLV